jgi:hypothetical protein
MTAASPISLLHIVFLMVETSSMNHLVRRAGRELAGSPSVPIDTAGEEKSQLFAHVVVFKAPNVGL